MTKKAIIFGGAFNPPTLAHALILKEVLTYASSINAEVWLLPSGNRSDKIIPTPIDRRMDLLHCLINDIAGSDDTIRIETMELHRDKEIETYDTVQEMNATYPDYDFTWVFGADSTQTMGQWKQGQWLLKSLNMVLINRPGNTINPECCNYKVLDITTPDISSTLLREYIQTKKNYQALVTPTVFQHLVAQYA